MHRYLERIGEQLLGRVLPNEKASAVPCCGGGCSYQIRCYNQRVQRRLCCTSCSSSSSGATCSAWAVSPGVFSSDCSFQRKQLQQLTLVSRPSGGSLQVSVMAYNLVATEINEAAYTRAFEALGFGAWAAAVPPLQTSDDTVRTYALATLLVRAAGLRARVIDASMAGTWRTTSPGLKTRR